MINWTHGHSIILLLSVIVLGLGILLILNAQEVKDLRLLITEQDTSTHEISTSKKPTLPTKQEVSPHLSHVQSIEKEAGMPLSRIAKLIIRDEGVRTKPYLDPNGVVTIGIGRSLETNGVSIVELHALNSTPDYRTILNKTTVQNGRIKIKTLADANKIFTRPLDKHDLELLLTDDLKVTKADAVTVFGDTWDKIDTVRQEAILDVIYNLGLTHFKGFHNFIASVKKQDWQKAASDLLLSEAARENITRYHRSASVIQTGDEKYFDLE